MTKKSPSEVERKAGNDKAWEEFGSKLAGVLSVLTEDQFLIISVESLPWFVQFAAQGAYGMRVEAVGNHYLEAPYRLSADSVATLTRLGWMPPTGTPGEATPRDQPDGSPNFFRQFEEPVPFEEVASLARLTLNRGFGVSLPGQLGYYSSDADGQQILLPTLGLPFRPLSS